MPRRVAFLLLTSAAGAAFAAGSAGAQQQTQPADCEPGFERRAYPHGSELNFRCRTRVIACPEKQGHYVAIIPEPGFETAMGVQFGYRCQYRSRER